MSDIAGHIKQIRKERGLTQEQLANKMHLTRQAISRWENGKTYPDIDSLTMLSKVLEVDITTLISGKESDTQGAFFRKKVKTIWIHILLDVFVLLLVVLALPALRKVAFRTNASSLSKLHICLDYFLNGVLLFGVGYVSSEIFSLYYTIRSTCHLWRSIILTSGLILLIPLVAICVRYAQLVIDKNSSTPVFHFFGFFIFSKSGSFMLKYLFPLISGFLINTFAEFGRNNV